MIITKQKDVAEIRQMVAPYKKVLILGCGICTTFCSTGGPDEVQKLAKDLTAEREDLIVKKGVVPRQCSEKVMDCLDEKAGDYEAIVSMACGNGVQVVARRFPDKRVIPALDTQFIGVEKEPGIWTEMCVACGDCVLGRTAGICPVTRCAKGLLNGPCGGAQEGKCEVSKDIPCAWQEIYHGLKRLGLLDYLKDGVQIKDQRLHPGRMVGEASKPLEGLARWKDYYPFVLADW
ncbi:MAG: hypothetical protein D4R73_07725 [Deltaproteobacteria bacterium]|nr:MAG: hypothetical protein D4R73_07725 [Deltaproteobacteria bacterium]